jgi:hypothetical protein
MTSQHLLNSLVQIANKEGNLKKKYPAECEVSAPSTVSAARTQAEVYSDIYRCCSNRLGLSTSRTRFALMRVNLVDKAEHR